MIQIMYQNVKTGAAHDITDLVSAATWRTQRSGAPASLEMTLLRDAAVQIDHGGVVTVKSGGTGLFYGYVFKYSQSEKGEIQVTAYDQTRYLKNKETYVFTGVRADQIAARLAADFGISTGQLQNTGYVISSLVMDNKTLFDIVLTALDHTLVGTGELYYLWDDFGKLHISNVRDTILPLAIGDGSLATGYTYTSDIDGDTANRVKLVRDNKESGRRDVYVFQDSDNMQFWGVLQYFEKVDQELNSAQISERGDNMLVLKNRPTRSFDVNAIADLSVRAGRMVYCQFSEAGIGGWYIVDECSQDLLKETMSLKMVMK